MEISGPACNLRINDNPDNWDIKKEMDAINEPTPGWVKDMDMVKVGDFMVARDSEVGRDIIKLRKRINILEKRWKALRKKITKVSKQPFGQDWIPATDVLDLMTEITRKIK